MAKPESLPNSEREDSNEESAAFAEVKAQFEAFTRGELHPSRLVANLAEICRNDSDVTWEALSLTDQYHRRGLLNTDVFINTKTTLNGIAFPRADGKTPSRPVPRPAGRDGAERANGAAPGVKGDNVRGNDAPRAPNPSMPTSRQSQASQTADERRQQPPPQSDYSAGRAGASPSVPIERFESTGSQPAFTASSPQRNSPPSNEPMIQSHPETPRYQDTAPVFLPTTGVAKIPLRATAVLVDRYVLVEPIHSTATATIFKAFDRQRSQLSEVERFVSVKGLNAAVASSPEVQRLLHDEYLQSKDLSHPNILATYDYQADGEASFLVQALLEGQLLSRLIERHAPHRLLQAQALAIVREIGLALAYAHEKHVVHGALTADMVIIGSNGSVRVFGFGSNGVNRDVISARSGLDISEDVFGVACIAYELLAGRPPFAYVENRRERRWTRIKSLTRKQWRELERGLQGQRSDRPTNMREWVMALVGNEAASFLPSYDYIGTEAPRRIEWLPILGKLTTAMVLVAVLAGAYLLMNAGAFKLPVRPNSDIAKSLEQPKLNDVPPKPEVTKAAPATPAATKSKSRNRNAVAPMQTANADSMQLAQNEPVAKEKDNTTETVEQRGSDLAAVSDEAIANADGPAKINFSTNRFTVASNESVARVNVVRRGDTSRPVMIKWRTLPGSAKPDKDYAATIDGELRIPVGETRATIIVPIAHGDAQLQGSKWFDVEITDVTNASLNASSTATVVIVGAE